MKKFIKTLKPGDLIIIVLLVVLSFLPVVIFSMNSVSTEQANNSVVISADGVHLHEMDLVDDGETETYEYVSEDGHRNVIVREGTEVKMIDASCPDQLCVRQGTITDAGETIVCLPHRLIVEVTSDNPDVDNDNGIDVIS